MADRNLELALRISGDAKSANAAVRSLDKEVGTLTSNLQTFARVAATAFGASFTTGAFLEANASMQSLNLSFAQITGSSKGAAEQMAFVRAEADRLGLVVQNAANSYLNLAASTKGTQLEGEPTRKIWTAVSEAMARLGKSGADTQGALLAISQMMSKGTVASEELRGQLAERLPGSFQIAARAMGVTTKELSKMLEQGGVVSDDFLPKFAAELDKTFGGGGQIETYNANLARLKNSITDAFVKIGSGGSFEAISKGIRAVSDNFEALSQAAMTTGAVIASIYAGKALNNLVAYGARLRATVADSAGAIAASQALARQQLISAEAVLVNTQRQAALLTGMQRLAFAQSSLIPALRQFEIAQDAVAAAGGRAAIAQRGLAAAVGFLGGPIGVVTTLLSLGTLAWLAWGNKAESAIDKVAQKEKDLHERVKEAQAQMVKESRFGAGQLGDFREELAVQEKTLALMTSGVAVTEKAKQAIANKRAEIAKLKDDIAKLEQAEKAQGEVSQKLAIDGKQLNKELNNDIKDQITAYKALGSAVREAWQESQKTEKQYLSDAKALRSKIVGVEIYHRPEDKQAAQYVDVVNAKGKLERLTSTVGTPLEDIRQQAELVRKLAEGLQDQADKQRALNDAYEMEARALEAAAAQEKQRQEGLRAEWAKNEQTVKDLQAALASLGKGTAINIQSDQAKAVLDEITTKLDALKDKTITVRVVKLAEDGRPLDNLSAAVPGKAAGGLLAGPGHDTSDNLLILGSPGEYMLRAAAVRHYGLPLIEAINSLRMPKFANGGLLSRVSPLHPIPPATAATAERTVNVNLNLEGGRYPMQAAPDVADALASAIRSAALKRGGR